LITIGLTVIAALAFAGLVYAQDATPATPNAPWGGRGAGGMMGGAGTTGGPGMMGAPMGGNWGAACGTGSGPMHTYMVEAYAQALGLTVEDVQAEFEAGKSMWKIAADQGLSDEEVQSVMVTARTAALSAMVADGVLS